MKYKTLKEIEERKAAILTEMEQEGADLDALKNEVEELRKESSSRPCTPATHGRPGSL